MVQPVRSKNAKQTNSVSIVGSTLAFLKKQQAAKVEAEYIHDWWWVRVSSLGQRYPQCFTSGQEPVYELPNPEDARRAHF